MRDPAQEAVGEVGVETVVVHLEVVDLLTAVHLAAADPAQVAVGEVEVETVVVHLGVVDLLTAVHLAAADPVLATVGEVEEEAVVVHPAATLDPVHQLAVDPLTAVHLAAADQVLATVGEVEEEAVVVHPGATLDPVHQVAVDLLTVDPVLAMVDDGAIGEVAEVVRLVVTVALKMVAAGGLEKNLALVDHLVHLEAVELLTVALAQATVDDGEAEVEMEVVHPLETAVHLAAAAHQVAAAHLVAVDHPVQAVHLDHPPVDQEKAALALNLVMVLVAMLHAPITAKSKMPLS